MQSSLSGKKRCSVGEVVWGHCSMTLLDVTAILDRLVMMGSK